MTLYVAFISALNLCIGYVLGVYLGILPGFARADGFPVPTGRGPAKGRHIPVVEPSNSTADGLPSGDVSTTTAENAQNEPAVNPSHETQPSAMSRPPVESENEKNIEKTLLTENELDEISSRGIETDAHQPTPSSQRQDEAIQGSVAAEQTTERSNLSDVADPLQHETTQSSADATRRSPSPEDPESAVAEDEIRDALTGLATRTSAETIIERFCHHAGASSSLPIALVQIDGDVANRQKYGKTVSDRLLAEMARMVGSLLGAEHSAARFDEQQLLLILNGESVDSATSLVDQFRQLVESAEFIADGTELSATISCGVAAASASVFGETLFQRLEEALSEAKRYGCNRTFWHDGSFPTPVVPQELPINSQMQVI